MFYCVKYVKIIGLYFDNIYISDYFSDKIINNVLLWELLLQW